MPSLLRASLVLSVCAACGEGAAPGALANPSARQGLTPLQSPCVFTPATGLLTIVLAAAELGVLERRLSDSALLINGVTCDGGGTFAKSTSALRATVTGDVSGGETFTFDYTNGLFLRGTSSAPAVTIDLGGGGTDVVQLRGSSQRDVMRAGALGWDSSGDGLRDLTLTNVASVVVTLGDGDDSFSGAGGGNLGGPTAAGLLVWWARTARRARRPCPYTS